MHKKLALVLLLLFVQTGFAAAYKVFIVSGEASGDELGEWYVQKLAEKHAEVSVETTQTAGLRIESQGFVGATTFLNYIPQIWRSCGAIAQYVKTKNFDEVVLVDLPLVNFLLARMLKRDAYQATITYIAPPEMWLWGTWGMHHWLRWYADRIIAIYPFEVEWYRNHGLNVEWLGYPYAKEIEPYAQSTMHKTLKVALLPGSRMGEVREMLPLFISVARQLKNRFPNIEFVLPCAITIDRTFLISFLEEHDAAEIITVMGPDDDKFATLASCCLAVTKPGTATLQLALLGVPMIIAYKTSWVTYWLARFFIQKNYVGLPNLLAQKEVCRELIQNDCTAANITQRAGDVIDAFLADEAAYQQLTEPLTTLRRSLLGHSL